MAENKSEQPTPRRRQKAREKGQIARSRELSGALAMAGVFAMVVWQGQDLLRQWAGTFRHSMDLAASEQFTATGPVMFWNSLEVLRSLTPILGTGLVLSVACGVAQGGLVFAPEALSPKFERISPAAKLKQMFSLVGLSGMLKSLLPFTAIAYIGVSVLQRHWGEMAGSSYLGASQLFRFLQALLVELGWKSGAVLLVWAGVDYFLNWRKLESDLRMTQQEIRDEVKETDGNPANKGRVRKLQRELRRKQQLRAAATATVVVTNPTHFAVALRYELDMDAPLVVAKGRDLLAEKIKEIARWEGIPIMENPPLAQALFRAVEVGQAIPAKLYAAVAEILVVVFRAQAEARQREAQRRKNSEAAREQG
jgi:flagellar biosynthetic protein FlhB